MTTGTEAEKPQDNSGQTGSGGTVLASGQLNDNSSLRSVLENVVARCQKVENGVLRILSKEVRGHIGIRSGTLITGANITNPNEFGRGALTKLLSANRGMFAFIALPSQQPELLQSLDININNILRFHPPGDVTLNVPHLSQAIKFVLDRQAPSEAELRFARGGASADSQLAKEAEEQFSTITVWSGGAAGSSGADAESITQQFNGIQSKVFADMERAMNAASQSLTQQMQSSKPQQAGPGPQGQPAATGAQPTMPNQNPWVARPQDPPQQGGPPNAFSSQPPQNAAPRGPSQPGPQGPQPGPQGPQPGPQGPQPGPRGPQPGPQTQAGPQGMQQAPGQQGQMRPNPSAPQPGGPQPGTQPGPKPGDVLQPMKSQSPWAPRPQDGAPQGQRPNGQQAMPPGQQPGRPQEPASAAPGAPGAARPTGQQPMPPASPTGQAARPTAQTARPAVTQSAGGTATATTAKTTGQTAKPAPPVEAAGKPNTTGTKRRRKKKKQVAEDPDRFAPLPEPIRDEGLGKDVIYGGLLGVALLVLLGYQSIQASAFSTHLSDGMDALKKGKNDVAYVEFGTSITANPTSADAYFYRALASVRLGNTDAALNDYSHVIQMDPNNPLAYIARASLYNKLGQYDAAITDCENALKAKPDFWEAYGVRAIAYNHTSRFSEALADSKVFLSNYKKKDKSRADVLANRAYSWFHKKQYDDALRDYSDAIACDLKNGSLYASRAVVYKAVRDWKHAIDDCNIAAKLLPGDTSVLKIRGLCYGGLGQSEASLKDLDYLVRCNPSVENHRMRGTARLQVHDFQGAYEDFEWVLGAKPHDKDARGKYEQARIGLQSQAHITASVADTSSSSETKVDTKGPQSELVKKGYDLMRSGEAEKAQALLTAAVKANPNDPAARRYLAYALVETGSNESAAAQFAALSKLQAMPPGDSMMYGQALMALKKTEQAIGIFGNMVASDPQNDQARVALIKAYIESKMPDTAIQLAQEGIARSPQLAANYQDLIKQAASKKK